MAQRRINQNRPETEGDPFEEFYATLRGAVWETQKGPGTWEKVAADANLAVSTVAKFAYGETQRPHLRTAFALMKASGLRLAPVAENTRPLDTEFVLTPAKKGALTKRTTGR